MQLHTGAGYAVVTIAVVSENSIDTGKCTNAVTFHSCRKQITLKCFGEHEREVERIGGINGGWSVFGLIRLNLLTIFHENLKYPLRLGIVACLL